MIFASNNQNKLNEIRKIFKDYQILSLKDVKIEVDVKEDGKTYFDNALKKAKEIFKLTKIPTIADDSGLEILGLNNWPGVMTKRICDDDTKRNMLFIEKCQNISDKRIKAVCVLVYYDGKNTITGMGKLLGTITDKIYEGNGFGFDKIFRLENGQVISSLTSEEKNTISARYLACKDLLERIQKNTNNSL